MNNYCKTSEMCCPCWIFSLLTFNYVYNQWFVFRIQRIERKLWTCWGWIDRKIEYFISCIKITIVKKFQKVVWTLFWSRYSTSSLSKVTCLFCTIKFVGGKIQYGRRWLKNHWIIFASDGWWSNDSKTCYECWFNVTFKLSFHRLCGF